MIDLTFNVFNFIDISFQTFGDGIDSPGVALSSSDIEQAAKSFVEKYLGISSPMGVAYESGYRAGKMTYAYVYQTDVSSVIGIVFMAYPLILYLFAHPPERP